jgi:hypothetical protein
MKVDYLTMKFKTFMISSQTKHESFNSFGSHAQLFMNIPIFFFESNEPILSFLFIFKHIETYKRLEYQKIYIY